MTVCEDETILCSHYVLSWLTTLITLIASSSVPKHLLLRPSACSLNTDTHVNSELVAATRLRSTNNPHHGWSEKRDYIICSDQKINGETLRRQ